MHKELMVPVSSEVRRETSAIELREDTDNRDLEVEELSRCRAVADEASESVIVHPTGGPCCKINR